MPRWTMRACTLNVHNWADGDGRGNAPRVESLLASLACDLVALQEVSQFVELFRLARALGMHVTHDPAGGATNVLLTRVEPRWSEVLKLEVHGAETRSAALAEIDTNLGPMVVAATHFSPDRESIRVSQFEQIVVLLAASGDRSLLLGDLNALRRADYAPRRWQSIADERARNRWEEPRDDLARRLDERGWVDLVRLGVAGSPVCYYESLGTPLPPQLASTCRFGTRVDYVLASPTLAAEVRVMDVSVPAADVSDHRPVVVHLASVSSP